MAVNYNDERFTQVENEKNEQIKQTTNTYNEMINNSDSYYQQQIDASKKWADKQAEIQQANTDHAINKIEQQKEQAEKDYTKEQKGAYTDYQKASNQYGVNAEKQATQGLQNSGYSESTRTSMYNTYQNRYMAARDSYNKAVLNYDNAIKDAQLANNSALATIAYEALQKQLELSLQGFQYKNTLVLQKTQAINEMNDRYYNRYQNVLSQINTENALAEQIRQYNETLAFQKQQAAQEQANWEKQFALSKAKSSGSSRSSGGSSSSKLTSGSSSKLSGSSSNSNTLASAGAGAAKSAAIATITNEARTLYNSSKNTAVVESYLGSALGKGQINKTEAESILKKLGLSGGGGSSGGGGR